MIAADEESSDIEQPHVLPVEEVWRKLNSSEDVILLWNEHPRVVTGTDILGRLLRGIARSASPLPVFSRPVIRSD